MCGGWSPIRNILETAGSLAGNYLLPGSSLLTDRLVSQGSQGQLSSPLGQLGQIGTGLAGGGAFGSGLQSAGGAMEQQGINSLFNSVGNGLSSLSNSTGLSDAGSNISNGLSNFADSTGLSSLFGGTAQPEGAFTEAYNGMNFGAPASADVVNAASTPNISLGNTLTTGGGNIGAVGGGTLGTGGTDALAGESIAAPSASGIGATGGLGGESGGIGGISPLAATTDNAASFNPSLLSGNSEGFLGVNPSTGAYPATSGLAVPIPQGGFLGSTSASPLSGGNNVGSLSSLFGSGASGAGNSGAGSNLLNSLLKGGLGYALNSPNTQGKNAINSATQQAEANFAPYLAAGNQAENTLANLYGNNGTGAQSAAFQNFQNTPGYQFALQQGLNAVNANAAALGSPLSGNNQQAVNNYAQGTANQTYNNYVNQLQNLASGGMSAAGGSGTAALTGANALSQMGQNNANARNTAVGQGLAGLFPSGLNIQQLLGQGSNTGNGGLLSLFGL